MQILCLDGANGDEGVEESGTAQVKFTIALREVSRADMAWAGTRAATAEWVVLEQRIGMREGVACAMAGCP